MEKKLLFFLQAAVTLIHPLENVNFLENKTYTILAQYNLYQKA